MAKRFIKFLEKKDSAEFIKKALELMKKSIDRFSNALNQDIEIPGLADYTDEYIKVLTGALTVRLDKLDKDTIQKAQELGFRLIRTACSEMLDANDKLHPSVIKAFRLDSTQQVTYTIPMVKGFAHYIFMSMEPSKKYQAALAIWHKKAAKDSAWQDQFTRTKLDLDDIIMKSATSLAEYSKTLARKCLSSAQTAINEFAIQYDNQLANNAAEITKNLHDLKTVFEFIGDSNTLINFDAAIIKINAIIADTDHLAKNIVKNVTFNFFKLPDPNIKKITTIHAHLTLLKQATKLASQLHPIHAANDLSSSVLQCIKNESKMSS